MYSQFFVLFAIMFTGYFFRKINLIDDAMNHGLNRFIVYFAYPCFIINGIGSLEMSTELLKQFLFSFLLYFGFFMLFAGYAYFYGKARQFPPQSSNVAEFAMVSPNNGFMGFPIALIFFGEQGLLFMLAHNAAMNFYFFSYGINLMRRNKEKEPISFRSIIRSFSKMISNSNILALIIGLILCGFHIPIPEPVGQYLTYIGSVCTPMAMIFIGSTLAGCSFLEIIRNRVVVESSVNKLIILPLLTLALLYFTPITPLVVAMGVLGNCFPAAATVSMLAEQEYQDKELSSKILFLSTIISMVTIPLTVKLIQMIFSL